ncbi:aminotransferase class III-fold pyridoxal phosphate-dependent enzyme [candidate division KSB1 bacterium]|nr:aminotransferase class III-fold pyridoxal phosphate-dependent enzyme [candidate division KSB1 bacterium]
MLRVKYQLPNFTEQDAICFADERYGWRAVARALPSERDQNFYLKTETGKEFVLKIANVAESREILDLQNHAMLHLAERVPLLAVPRVCKTTAGESITTITSNEGATYFMRLLTYVPGKLLAHVKPHSPELLHSLGHALGTIDLALQDFSHPAARRDLKWDLIHAGWIRDYVQHLAPPTRQTIVERFLAPYESNVLPVLGELRASVIYNDANDYNVLVGNADSPQMQVIGVIDFGDMVHTNTICELAIATAYAMMDKADPLTAAAHVVLGYHQVFPLTEPEMEVLFPLICIRLCLTVTNSAYQRVVEPDNQYLTISEKPAWALLEKLAEVSPQLAHYTFRHACNLPPCPKTRAVVQWLQNNAGQIGRVVEPDLKTCEKIIFDLSVDSPMLSILDELANTEAFTKNLFARMRASHTNVGIGKYNEARPFYTSEAFRMQGNDGPDWRTVHIGLDVFMEPGSPVFAPLDGIVHGFRNNEAPLDYGPTIILQHNVDDGETAFFTLYGHLSTDSLDGLYEGMPVKQGAQLGHIGNYPLNGGWPPHLHFQIITDMLGRSGEFPGVALPHQRKIWLSLSPDPNLITRIPHEYLRPDEMRVEQILAVREKHIGKNLSISYKKPLEIVRGFMQYLYDEDGRRYLDAVNNVPHVGHCHPRVVKAGQEQMAVLNTNTRYLHENLARYAERLCATLPAPLRVCYFVCSGSEANELALRLARAHTKHKDSIVVDAGYHGNTTSLIEISSYKFDGPGGNGAPPHVHKVQMPDVYRGIYKKNDPRVGEKYAQRVVEAIAQIQQRGNNVGAFICESILSCGGQIVLPENYLEEAYRHVRHTGGVCIADEVQTGFGRVGTHFWAFETQGVVPDIVTLGKPIGNGHPLGAVVTTPEIAASFANGMEYFNTYGGNPVSCAIGLAVLDVIRDEGLQANALKAGAHLMNGLRQLMHKHLLIGDVRGLGLFAGIELVSDRETLAPATEQASYVANRMKECGVLLSTDGPFHNVLKIKPPLVFTKADADFLVATLDRILEENFLQVKSS